MEVAQSLGRRWLGVDAGRRAVHTSWKRLIKGAESQRNMTRASYYTTTSFRNNLDSLIQYYGFTTSECGVLTGMRDGVGLMVWDVDVGMEHISELLRYLAGSDLKGCVVLAPAYSLESVDAIRKSGVQLDCRILLNEFQSVERSPSSWTFPMLHRGNVLRLYNSKDEGRSSFSLKSLEQVGKDLGVLQESKGTEVVLRHGLVSKVEDYVALSSSTLDSVDYWYIEREHDGCPVVEWKALRTKEGIEDTSLFLKDLNGESDLSVGLVDVFGIRWRCHIETESI